MKVMIKVFSIFVLFIMAVSCAIIPSALPEKYNFDNNLEAVDQISTFKKPSWEQIDNQSIILRVNWKDYYLLVLRRPINTLNPMTIGVSSTVSTITSGYDRIAVRDNKVTQYYVIDKIYKLKGKDQVKRIKEQLSKN